MEQLCFDMALIFLAWMGTGILFYSYCDEGWSVDYAWFYATNVGLGVGYGYHAIKSNATKYFTVVFCMMGTSIIAGGLALFYDLLSVRLKSRRLNNWRDDQPTVCLPLVGNISRQSYKLLLIGGFYWGMIAAGIAVGYLCQGYTDFADCLLFAVTNYTTAGLLTPKDNWGSLVFTSITLTIGIPANVVFWGELTSSYFNRFLNEAQAQEEVDDDEDESGGDSEKAAPRTFGKFLEAELLNAGMVTQANIETLKASFLNQQGGK